MKGEGGRAGGRGPGAGRLGYLSTCMRTEICSTQVIILVFWEGRGGHGIFIVVALCLLLTKAVEEEEEKEKSAVDV